MPVVQAFRVTHVIRVHPRTKRSGGLCVHSSFRHHLQRGALAGTQGTTKVHQQSFALPLATVRSRVIVSCLRRRDIRNSQAPSCMVLPMRGLPVNSPTSPRVNAGSGAMSSSLLVPCPKLGKRVLSLIRERFVFQTSNLLMSFSDLLRYSRWRVFGDHAWAAGRNATE